MSNYLLEIGVEEFPSRFIASTKQQFRLGMEKLLAQAGLQAEDIVIESTPRRFTLWVNHIVPVTQDNTEIIKGPARRIAFAEDGTPSKALLGFLKSKELSLDDIYFEQKGKEEYVFAKKEKQQVSVSDVLKEGIPQLIRSISNPRSMRWGGRELQFLRPIRWFVSLLDDAVLLFDLEGIPVGRTTKGHRFLGSSALEIPSIDAYEHLLEENYVIIREKKRREIIVRGLNRLAKERGGSAMLDEELLDEVVSIVEYPTVFLGNIPEQYLDLPSEFIITPMKDHQRYFPVLDDHQNLLPFFLSVRNGDQQGIENVVAGNEKVLTPRLEDAKFFFEQDRKQPLEAYLPKLNELVFHESLGTMAQKVERLEILVEKLGQLLRVGEDTKNNAKRAATLSKADLVTQMVVEFTELQGTVGRIYAKEDEEPVVVATALEEQYMPRSSGADLPQSTAGIVLALADRLDTLAGLYAIDVRVTGSQDPFGLRRAAIGIIDILLANDMPLDLQAAFRETLLTYVDQQQLVFDYEEVIQALKQFFVGRLQRKLRDEGWRYDIVDAVLATEEFDVVAIVGKIKALSAWAKEDTKDALFTTFVRVHSMAEKALTEEIAEEALTEEDRTLYESLHYAEEIQEKLAQRHYGQALETLNIWAEEINRYMDENMILVEDEAVRTNRLALLKRISLCVENFFHPQDIVRK